MCSVDTLLVLCGHHTCALWTRSVDTIHVVSLQQGHTVSLQQRCSVPLHCLAFPSIVLHSFPCLTFLPLSYIPFHCLTFLPLSYIPSIVIYSLPIHSFYDFKTCKIRCPIGWVTRQIAEIGRPIGRSGVRRCNWSKHPNTHANICQSYRHQRGAAAPL